ncbi:MAG: XRE family transcriptional regulator [Gammaproteobacteria bacterium]|jgi:predicted XRE-type DNA-binding protein|nr:XRE family transcriptional regulator [Gammaproteobacteria bacterium]
MSSHIKKSTGNVFADLGVKNPEEALVKARLAHVISDAISTRGMTQVDAAAFLGIDQPKVSRLVRGQLAGFSLDRLFRFVTLLGGDIKITVVEGRPKSRRAGHMKIALN